MSDPIDRQAAIDALKGLEFCHYMEFGEYIGEDTREVRLIRAEKAQDALQNLPSAQPDNDMIHLQKEQAYLQGWEEWREALQKKQRWTPIKVRPMDDEERKEWSERLGYDIEYEDAVTFDCHMPDDGQEVWVCSKCGNVWQDTCLIDEGIYLEENGDWDGIVAWMPFDKPEPYQEEGSE